MTITQGQLAFSNTQRNRLIYCGGPDMSGQPPKVVFQGATFMLGGAPLGGGAEFWTLVERADLVGTDAFTTLSFKGDLGLLDRLCNYGIVAKVDLYSTEQFFVTASFVR